MKLVPSMYFPLCAALSFLSLYLFFLIPGLTCLLIVAQNPNDRRIADI